MSIPGRRVSGAPVLGVCCVLSSIVGPTGIRIQAGMNTGTHRRGGPSFYFSLRGLVWHQGWGQGGGLLRKLQHAWLGLEHIFGGELYVAPEGVALPPPEGLEHGRGEAHGTRDRRAPDAEGVGVQVARGRECPMEDVPQAGPGQVRPAWNANNGPTKVGCVPSNWCNAVKGQRAEPVWQEPPPPPPPPPPTPRKGSVFDTWMCNLATPHSGSRVRSLYCRWTPGSKRRGLPDLVLARSPHPALNLMPDPTA